jgi:hypothetical protein
MDTVIELQTKINNLIKKWKDKVPEKNTNEWWRYRADQSLYVFLKSKLDSLTKKK